MTDMVSAKTLKQMLSDGDEIALLDVREHGIYGEGHPFFAIPLAYSRFEADLPRLVPNPRARTVLLDDDDGVAVRAAAAARDLGYTNVSVLDGGAAAWKAAGYTLYQGVNLPSKTFGELVEIERHTPHVSAEDLQKMRDRGENMVIVDGRPITEYTKFNIPDGICCPNGELALRINAIAPDPETRIVVNCAGRTRSIIGAQTLIDYGVKNPVMALENGTQGWFLAGLEVENGGDRIYPEVAGDAITDAQRAQASAFAQKCGVSSVDAQTVSGWLAEDGRTTYVFDVRTPEEFAEKGARGTVHAPGGQLIQATDQWVGIRHSRLVLVDTDGVRAPMVAGWLRQLGHDAVLLEGGLDAAAKLPDRSPSSGLEAPSSVTAADVAKRMENNAVHLVDTRPSMTYREGHIDGARWSIRPRLASAVSDTSKPVILIDNDPVTAALTARDLKAMGVPEVLLLSGTPEEWKAAGLAIVATPDDPPDSACIDYLFFTHERHAGVEAASRQYLEWEIGLVDQLDEQERAAFRIIDDRPN